MTTTKIILSVTAVVVTAFAAYAAYEGPLQALIERHPDIDPKIVRKVHHEMFMEALRGKYNDIVTDDDALDKILIEKVQLLTIK